LTAVAVEHGASFERVLRALEDAGRTVRRRGTWQASAQCPAHEDGEPSLSVTWRDGKTLLHCFNGCTDAGSSNDPTPVLQALGLASSDLFDEPLPPRDPDDRPRRAPRRRLAAGTPAGPGAAAEGTPRPRKPGKRELLGKPTGRWRVVAEYVYTDEHGEPVGKVVREQRQHEHGYDKRFWQRHWTGQCGRDPCEEKRDGITVLHQDGWGKDAPQRKVLYNLPWVIAAVAAGHEVWLAEGEKDADALNEHFRTHGLSAVATTYASGAGSWRDEYGAVLAGAHVVIVEDNDPDAVNPVTGEPGEPAGRKRSRRLLAALEGTAASVRVVRAKTGKDSFDHLAAGHAIGDFEPVTVPPLPEAEQTEGRAGLRLLRGGGGGDGSGGTGGGADDGERPNRRVQYMARHGEIVKVTTGRDGIVNYDVVLGCLAQVVRVDQKVITGDEPASTTGYLLRAEHPGHPGEPHELRVPRKSWDSGDWLHDLPWPSVTFDSSRNGLAKVRDAVRLTSPAATVATVHGAPGWVRGGDGEWIFIHAGGALGAGGPVAAETDLPPKLTQFILPDPPRDPAQLRAAAAHSTGLVQVLPPRIGAVLAGLAYRAAVSRMPPSVTLLGPPGSYKTSMGKVSLHHFAPDLPFDQSVLSLSERGATGNAGARLMHLTRDILLLADDAAPDRSLKAAAERVASIVRLQYNGETRDRLDRETEMRRPDPPRGSLLVSAEVGPSAASASQRTLIVPFHQGEISRETMLSLWEPESRHGRAAALASFVTWQAGRRDEVLERLAGLTREYADTWNEAGHEERTAEALAHLAAGWRLMLDHLTDLGAVTADESAQLWQQAWDGLNDAGRMQNDPDEPSDPAGRILARLRTGLLGRYGHLTTRTGSPPAADEAPRYGWTVEPASPRSGLMPDAATPILRSSGADWIGAYADENGERRLWLVPDLTLIMLRKVADRLGEPFEETTSSVGEWLRQAGVGLRTTQEKATGRLRRSKQQIMPGGKRQWVWDIPESALFDDDTGGTPGPDDAAPPAGGPDAGHGETGPGQDDGEGGNVGGQRFDEDDTPAENPGAGREEDPCPAEPARSPGTAAEDAAPAGGDVAPAPAAGPVITMPPEPRPEPGWESGWPPGTIGAQMNPPRRPAAPARASTPAAAPAAAAGTRGRARLIPYPQLLDLAAQDGLREKAPAVLRRRYCEVTGAAPGQALPCAGCGGRSTVLVGGVPLHLTCPDPPPGWQPPPAPGPATATTAPVATARADGAAAAQARPGTPVYRGKTRSAAEVSEHRWRAAAAVLDADGIYLPGGEKLPPPADVSHAGMLADLPTRLELGWGGGKLPPHTGQLWLTAGFLQRAGLPVPAEGQQIEDTERMLEEAAVAPFITGAVAAGWEISEASRTRLGHRMRIWRATNRAGAQLVFVPYISGDVALLDGDPGPAALAARLDMYARHTGVPYGRSAAYSGHDLLLQLDARRKIVLSGPAEPPPVQPAGTGLISFQRAPTEKEASRRFVHSYDTTAAWLAAAKGTEYGVGEAVHRDRPVFDPKLPGVWRVTPPAWDTWAIPNPFAVRRKRDDGTAWYYTPLLAMAADLLDAQIRPVEAWVWPEHTRYLDLWAAELNKARLALSGPPPGYRPEDPDAAAVLAAVKDTYSGAVTLFGSSQLDAAADRLILYPRLLELASRDGGAADVVSPATLRRRYCRVTFAQETQAQPCASCGTPSTELVGAMPLHLQCPDPPAAEGGGRERHKLFREDWAYTGIGTAGARLYRKILQVEEITPGLWPLAIDRDNLLYASDNPDPEQACPPPLKTGNGLGQVKNKGSGLMADATPLLGKGRFSFDNLIPPARWDSVRGGPRAENT
jgi:hypothetical protein